MVRLTAEESGPARDAVRGVLTAAYGLCCYLAFVLVSLYGVAFLADTGVARTVDRGGPQVPTAAAVGVDALLLLAFALQHSVMARPAFKRHCRTLVPAHLERATFVLAASTGLALLFWQWRPLSAVVWDVPVPAARTTIWVLYALGWWWVFASTFAIDHFDMFGLRQIVRHLRGLPAAGPTFALPLPYRLVRHPMMVGFFVAFLAAPTMTAGHLLFAGAAVGYILVGVRLEERDLAAELPPYREYASTTPRFLPAPRRFAIRRP